MLTTLMPQKQFVGVFSHVRETLGGIIMEEYYICFLSKIIALLAIGVVIIGAIVVNALEDYYD